jgi:hypothetical protein
VSHWSRSKEFGIYLGKKLRGEMQMTMRRVLLAGSLGLLATASSLLFSHPADASEGKPKPVEVTNIPLPVQGTITVQNPLDGNGNPIALIVRDRDNPAFQPYSIFCTGKAFTNTDQSSCSFELVPSGKTLVIEEVSVAVDVTAGQGIHPASVSVGTQPRSNFFGTNHYLALTAVGDTGSGLERYVTHQPTRLYHVGGTGNPAGCSVVLNLPSTLGEMVCTISGYFVNTP